ncbi:MAG: restriction endonuclease subunit S, partial [Campylobacterales bacterium]|nr:restriction endonuclease subunit S [Campylobacterales bacterium]
PKYSDKSDSIILNQKCIRWNCIELEHSKSVDDDWYQNIDKIFFTKKGDILINSTGDGTIGRATCITEKYINLIYDSHILLLRVNPDKINPMFLTYFINSSLGQLQIENIKSAVATKQTELGINNLKNMQFILPPIDIQNEIAEKIELLKNEIKLLNQKSEQNIDLAIQNFESEIFNEA